MSSRKNRILAVTLLVLTILSVALAWWGRGEERTEIDPQLFAVSDTEKISHVTMARAEDTVELSFDEGRWLVNNTWPADLQMIKVLMAALRQVEPHRPVSAARADSVNALLKSRGTAVTLTFSDGGSRSYTVGGSRGKTEAWFRNEGDPTPYVAIIPGYRVYVSGIFEMDAGGWRNKRVFDFNWRNFKSLTASFPREPKADFVVEMNQRYFGVRGMTEVDTTRLNDYLDAVSLLFARRYVPENDPIVASGMKQPPVSRLEIRDIADRVYTLDLFTPGKDDDEVLGRLADGQWVSFDRAEIFALVRRREYFRPGN